MSIYIYVCMYMYICIHIYIYTSIYIYVNNIHSGPRNGGPPSALERHLYVRMCTCACVCMPRARHELRAPP